MKIIAHRGFSSEYPENTLLAFQKAIDAGADGIETDLRLSSDDKVVIFHDNNLKRIAKVDKTIGSLTLEEIKELDVGSGETIPTLDETLELIDAKVTLILEIKYNPSTYKTICQKVSQSIGNKLSWVEVSCFNDTVLEYMYELNPQIKLHKLIEKAEELQSIDFEKDYSYVSYFDIEISLHHTVMQMGLFKSHKIIFWSVDKEDISKEIDAGLYGVMTNNPKH